VGKRPIPPALLTRLNGVPLVLEPRAFAALLAGEPLMPSERDRTRARDYEVEAGTAIVPVHGILMHRGTGADWLDDLFGVVSAEALGATLRTALADPAVTSVLLDVDSPGGEVSGLFDLGDLIFAARGTKPLVAVANEWAASGGYLLASAADRVLVPRTGMVGSVGAMIARLDVSKLDEELGIQYAIFTSGARKSDGNPHVALSDEERARIQQDADNIGRLFEATVARNRGIDAEQVRGLEAGVFRGVAGVRAGLADAIGTFHDALTQLRAGGTGRRRRGAMATERTAEPVETEAARPPATVIDFEKVRAEAQATARREEQTRVRAIGTLCRDAGLPGLTALFVEEGLSAEAATARLAEAKQITALGAIAQCPELATEMIAQGVSLAAAVDRINTQRGAAAGGPIRTHHGPASERETPRIDVVGIYAARAKCIAEAKAGRPEPIRVG
jgi:signal peptide peptidase SppA